MSLLTNITQAQIDASQTELDGKILSRPALLVTDGIADVAARRGAACPHGVRPAGRAAAATGGAWPAAGVFGLPTIPGPVNRSLSRDTESHRFALFFIVFKIA